MGKKKEMIMTAINKTVSNIGEKEGVDKIKILKGLLRDLDLKKEDRKYPHINLNIVGIEGGIERVKEILTECIKSAEVEKEKAVGEIKNSEYYKEVKRYTQNFECLMGDMGIINGIHGHRHFDNPEFEKKFKKFKMLLIMEKPQNQKEEAFIRSILAGKSKTKVEDLTERAILESRIESIDREKMLSEKRKRENEPIGRRIINNVKLWATQFVKIMRISN